MDTRYRGFRHNITLVAIIKFPVDVGIRLEIALVYGVCTYRVYIVVANHSEEHSTRWVIVAGRDAVLNRTVDRSDVVIGKVDSDDRGILSIQFDERHPIILWNDIAGAKR